MRKMIEAIKRWWDGITPQRQTTLAIGYDISICLLLCSNGAIVAVDLLWGRWVGWVNGVILLLLCVVIVFRNYWWRKLLLAQKEQIKLTAFASSALEDENRQLKEVALSAVAVKIMIEHGLPVNLEPLTRSLRPFEPEAERSKMN